MLISKLWIKCDSDKKSKKEITVNVTCMKKSQKKIFFNLKKIAIINNDNLNALLF